MQKFVFETRSDCKQSGPEFYGNVSPEFKKEISFAWDSLHPDIRAAIVACNIKIICPHNLADYKPVAVPQAVLKIMAGGAGPSWAGLYEACIATVVVPENLRFMIFKGWYTRPNEDVGKILYHEIGHALDDMLSLTKARTFRRLFEKDTLTESLKLEGDLKSQNTSNVNILKRLKAAFKIHSESENAYYFSNTWEAFAENWAQANLPRSISGKELNFAENFPRISAWVADNAPSNISGWERCRDHTNPNHRPGPFRRYLNGHIRRNGGWSSSFATKTELVFGPRLGRLKLAETIIARVRNFATDYRVIVGLPVATLSAHSLATMHLGRGDIMVGTLTIVVSGGGALSRIICKTKMENGRLAWAVNYNQSHPVPRKLIKPASRAVSTQSFKHRFKPAL